MRMKPKPLISVIIPTLNEEKYIEPTLNALNSQDFERNKYEIIIADSKSKDKTAKIAKKYADEFVVTSRKTPGAGRNAGEKIAKGKILVFIDADTLPRNNLLKTVAKTFENKKVKAAAVPVMPLEYHKKSLLVYLMLNEILVKPTIFLKNPVIASICFAVRKEAFEKIGGFNENLNVVEDIEFFMKLRKISGITKFLDQTTVFASVRRIKKWGALKNINAWPFDYIRLKILNKTSKYSPVR